MGCFATRVEVIVFIDGMKTAHIEGIDLQALLVLAEVLRVRNTSVAAKRLGRTQSAVSHALARLRLTLRDPLFIRAGGALKPTALAEELEPKVLEVIAGMRAIVTRAQVFDPAKLVRTFTIGGTDYAEIVIMPRLIPLLRKEAPGVTVVTRFLGDELDRAVATGEVDLAYASRFKPLAGIVQKRIGREEMLVLLRKGHPALKKPLTLATYAALDHVLVAPRGNPGGVVDGALEERGLRRRVVLMVPHFAAAAMIVAQTDLVATMPAGFARRMEKAAPLRAIAPPFDIPGFSFSIGFRVTTKDDPAHTWFRARVIDASRDG